MTVQSLRRLFTIDEYHKMIDAGILQEADRVELLDGEIQNMRPIDSAHAVMVKRLNQRLQQWFGDRAIVSVQDPITLNDYSEPIRKEKLPRYAAASIPEVWIVNLKQQVIEQYTQPDGKLYLNRKLIKQGTITTTCVTPALALPVERIFGQKL